jgi:2-oxoglutarate ferredoxin oxidoreductase subunit alpha
MLTQDLNWKITAKAGEGVMLSSSLFAKLCKRHGMSVYNYYEYPSLIKGGVQSGQVAASYGLASCQRKILNVLILYHESFLPAMLPELAEDSLIIVNAQSFDASKYPELKSKVVPMNLTKISREATGTVLSTNMVALGVSAVVFGLNLKVLGEVVAAEFAHKPKIAELNLKAIEMACSAAKTLQDAGQLPLLGKFDIRSDEQILLSGNEAVGLGALAAGLQFYSAYPMTPASGLLHYLAAQQANYPLVVKHTEDEIAAINQALGASFAGVRAMTGSSGGGFALMVEALSFAGVAEIPLVILEATRQGPATGLPTWTSQGDLNFVLGAGHGDFLRVILTPSSVEEHYVLTKRAFELAEKYQIPVFILSDKQMLESQQSMPHPEPAVLNSRQSMIAEGQLGEVQLDENYRRYANTDNGISPRSIPGQKNGWQLTNSYEHDTFGFATEDAKQTKAAADKRFRKLPELVAELPEARYYGAEDPEKIFFAFGSTVGVLQGVLAQQPAQKIALIELPCVFPLPLASISKILAGKSATLWTVEGNVTGQLAELLRREAVPVKQALLRYDGRPFYVEDILAWLSGQNINEQYKVLEYGNNT